MLYSVAFSRSSCFPMSCWTPSFPPFLLQHGAWAPFLSARVTWWPAVAVGSRQHSSSPLLSLPCALALVHCHGFSLASVSLSSRAVTSALCSPQTEFPTVPGGSAGTSDSGLRIQTEPLSLLADLTVLVDHISTYSSCSYTASVTLGCGFCHGHVSSCFWVLFVFWFFIPPVFLTLSLSLPWVEARSSKTYSCIS